MRLSLTLRLFSPMRNELAISLLIFLGIPRWSVTHAQWSGDPGINTPLSIASGSQFSPLAATDGERGAIVAWDDGRIGTDFDVYAQRLDSLGNPQWTTNGLAITTAEYQQWLRGVVSDGSGGAIIVWADEGGFSTNLYAQRVSNDGVLMWDSTGVPICEADEEQTAARVVSDGLGGAIVVWEDLRAYPNSNVYAQRIDSNGVAEWTNNGVVLSTAEGNHFSPFVESIGDGGAVISWIYSPYGTPSEDVYAQRIDASGATRWIEGGVIVSDAQGTQGTPRILTDGRGSSIVIWNDRRNGGIDLYAQRLDSLGNQLWDNEGISISLKGGNHLSHYAIPDSEGGAFVCWRDTRSTNGELYSQLVDSSGVVQWVVGGVWVAGAETNPYLPLMVTDQRGGFIIAWNEGIDPGGLHAQRVNRYGQIQWDSTGVLLSTAAVSWDAPRIVSDYEGDVIAVWSRDPSGFDIDLYAQQISRGGILGTLTDVAEHEQSTPSEFRLFQNYPNPFNPSTTIRFSMPQSGRVSLTIFTLLGEQVATLVSGEMEAGAHSLQWDATGQPSGVYFYRLQAGEFVETKKLVLMR